MHFGCRFERMMEFSHLSLNSLPLKTLSNLLKGRISKPHLLKIHAKVFVLGAHQDNLIATRLIGHYPSQPGYAKLGQSEEALQLFLFMVRDSLRPDDETMVSVLSACSNLDIENYEKWAKVLSEFEGNCGSNRFCFDAVNIVLVYLYGKLGKVEDGRHVFNKISVHGKTSVISWNVVIGAYVQNADALEALSLFRQMEDYNSCPNHVTMVSVLSACAQIGDLELGVKIHNYMKSEGWKGCLASNRNLNTTLIDMYCKCGDLKRARDVFGGMFAKDVVSFNVMIMGLAINGEGHDALSMFFKMQDVGLIPDAGTFLGVLCACSHSGFLEKGRRLFADMSQHFFIYPKLEHYACYVDLLSRSGCIQEALEVVMSMPYEPNGFVLGSLLAGCVLHKKLEYGENISKMLIRADPENSAGYVLLSNAYASDRRWGDVSELRCFMKEKGVKKHSGNSWISIEGTVHEFLAGSPSHPQIGQILDILDELSMKMKLGITYGNYDDSKCIAC